MNNQSPSAEGIRRELSERGAVFTKTHGKSMKPLLREGRDAVLLKRPDREIEKYDVVLYTDPLGRQVLHRVIGKRADAFIIRGDNTYKKEIVPKEAVFAYMESFSRKGKHRSTERLGYKLYSRVWNFIYPIRFLFHKFILLTKKIFKRK